MKSIRRCVCSCRKFEGPVATEDRMKECAVSYAAKSIQCGTTHLCHQNVPCRAARRMRKDFAVSFFRCMQVIIGDNSTTNFGGSVGYCYRCRNSGERISRRICLGHPESYPAVLAVVQVGPVVFEKSKSRGCGAIP